MDGIALLACTLQPRTLRGTAPHTHPAWEFHLAIQGTATFVGDRGRIAVRPGLAWYTRPRASHHLEGIPDHLLQYIVHAQLPAALGRSLDRAWGPCCALEVGQGCEADFWTMQELLRRATPHARQAAAHRFAAWLHERLDRSAAPSAHGPPAAAERMRAFLDQRMHLPVTLAAVAQAGGVSRAHASRIFHRAYGQPPLAWQRAQRLRLARRWLQGTDLPIAAVAAEVGFADPLYFSRAVRAHFGLSPSELRRAAAG